MEDILAIKKAKEEMSSETTDVSSEITQTQTTSDMHKTTNHSLNIKALMRIQPQKGNPNKTEDASKKLFINTTNIFLYASNNIKVSYKKEVYEFTRLCSKKRTKCKPNYDNGRKFNVFDQFLLNLSSVNKSRDEYFQKYRMITKLLRSSQNETKDKINETEIMLCSSKSSLKLTYVLLNKLQ